MVKVFTVYDSKAEAYLPPFYARSTGDAIRRFSDTANDVSHDFNKHAADFTLFEIGEFDELQGVFNLLPANISRGCALDYKGVDSD